MCGPVPFELTGLTKTFSTSAGMLVTVPLASIAVVSQIPHLAAASDHESQYRTYDGGLGDGGEPRWSAHAGCQAQALPELVGVAKCAHQRPAELSLGPQGCVSRARHRSNLVSSSTSRFRCSTLY